LTSRIRFSQKTPPVKHFGSTHGIVGNTVTDGVVQADRRGQRRTGTGTHQSLDLRRGSPPVFWTATCDPVHSL
jgi:hypothetical protein